ncbi:MAG TPA: Yip1 family protein [Verrucomicrobiae bacterium]|jgi:hypothetical protein|nr:Yip1 family protein [Verrucomicrobiae bacterium]
MFKSLNLLFSPEKEWQKIALNPPSLAVVAFGILLLIAVTLGVEAWGLMKFGEGSGEFGRMHLPNERVLKYAVFYGVGSLLAIIIVSRLLKDVGHSFNLQAPFPICFILIAFGYSPILLFRCADAFPSINTWICWAIGAVLSLRILYHGVALWLRPEQTKGFGIFMVSFLLIVVLSGLVHFSAIQVLHGRFLKEIYPDRPLTSPLSSTSSTNDRLILLIAHLHLPAKP